MQYSKKHAGFTLIELLVSISMFAIFSTVVHTFITDFQMKIYLNGIKTKALSNVTILDNTVSGIIINSYWIDYSSLNVDGNLDSIELYNDKLEQGKVRLYVDQDIDKDISRVYMSIWWNNIPLHSTELFITSFNISTSPPPVGWNLDIQPWVAIEYIWRTRSPLEQPTDDDYYDHYNKSEVWLKWRWLIRNYVPSSWKN